MSEIDWSKAPEGATHYNGNKSRRCRWMQKSPGGQWFFFHEGDQEWRAQGGSFPEGEDKLVERPASAWTGEGLPPVGTVCEWTPWSTERRVVEILAYHGDEVWMKYRDHADNTFTVASPAFFYPIPTPEQIAAEELVHATRNACTDIARTLDRFKNDIPGSAAAISVIKAMIDAGYRKQEQRP